MISGSSTPKRATPGKFATKAIGMYPWRATNGGGKRLTAGALRDSSVSRVSEAHHVSPSQTARVTVSVQS